MTLILTSRYEIVLESGRDEAYAQDTGEEVDINNLPFDFADKVIGSTGKQMLSLSVRRCAPFRF